MRTIAVTIVTLLTLASSAVVAQEQKNESTLAPGVLLTFDDRHNIHRWTRQLDLFEKYGAHATFFINYPEKFTQQEIDDLKLLTAAGMAIGVHGVHHVKSVDYIDEHGAEAFLAEEVVPALEALRAIGLEPTSFAYPMSQHDVRTDAALKTLFRHARSGKGIPEGKTMAETDLFFTPVSEVKETFTLVGRGNDLSSPESIEKHVYPALERAKQRGEIVVFYSHSIAPEGKSHFIRPAVLEMILAKAKELGLKFYTYDDLP